MTTLDEQNNLFKLLGEKLKKNLECFVVGGSAMLYHGAKNLTKDVDIVFNIKEDREKFVKVLEDLGFKKRQARFLYTKKKITELSFSGILEIRPKSNFYDFEKRNVPILMERENERFDLFYDKIIDMKFTESIKERITKTYEYDNLIVKVIAPEDIILLKCATERAGDRLDALELIKKFNINWEVIIEESLNQAKLGGDAYPVLLFDFLSELKEDLKADIPTGVIKKIRKIAEEVMIKKIRENRNIKGKKYRKKEK